jgi:Holliday junction resolvase RusA-like endonuclease
MRSLSFTVPGEARGKGRPRMTTRNGHAQSYTDAKTASYEGKIALAAHEALKGAPLLDGALCASVMVRIAPPMSASKKARAAMLAGEVLPTKKPDLDNIIKAVLDGCNGVAFRDDALICWINAGKRYAETAGVDVTFEPDAIEIAQEAA